MPELDYFLAIRPLAREKVCGDIGIIKEFDNRVFIGIVDVAGHDEDAGKAVLLCKDFLEKNYRQDLATIMESLHQQMKELNENAVVGLCLLDLKKGELTYIGVGNITLRKFGSSNVSIVPRSGIIGFTMLSLKEEEMILHDGDVLVLYTDGVEDHFDLEDYPELLVDNAETVATYIINQFGKVEDDAACIVLRYQR